MAELPPLDSPICGLADSDEIPTVELERWQALRRALGRAQTARMVDPEHPLPRIGRFEGVRHRSQGGFGVVFKARDPILDRYVAIKFCLLPDDELRELLIHEAKLMAKFSHPNIVTVYETGWYEDDVFFVMEYVEGKTAYDFIYRKPRPSWAEIIALYRGAGAGLAAAHEQGIVHSDFKPSNILLGADDWPRVTDFGLAHYDISDEGEGSTRYGTRPFMAPEALEGGRPDALSDQWSFCVALWLTFDRALPFAGKTYEEIREAIAAGPVEHDPSVPEELRAVARRGLAVDPRERFPNMRALLAELEDVLIRLSRSSGNHVISASDSSPALRFSQAGLVVPPEREGTHRYAATALAVCTALVLGAGAGVAAMRDSTQPPDEKLAPRQASPACVVEDNSVTEIPPYMDMICHSIRSGDVGGGADTWRSIRKDSYPALSDPNFKTRMTDIIARTKIVHDTLRTVSESEKRPPAMRSAASNQVKAMSALLDADQRSLGPSN